MTIRNVRAMTGKLLEEVNKEKIYMKCLIFNFFNKMSSQLNRFARNSRVTNCDSLNGEICKKTMSVFMFVSRYLYANNSDSVCIFLQPKKKMTLQPRCENGRCR